MLPSGAQGLPNAITCRLIASRHPPVRFASILSSPSSLPIQPSFFIFLFFSLYLCSPLLLHTAESTLREKKKELPETREERETKSNVTILPSSRVGYLLLAKIVSRPVGSNCPHRRTDLNLLSGECYFLIIIFIK